LTGRAAVSSQQYKKKKLNGNRETTQTGGPIVGIGRHGHKRGRDRGGEEVVLDGACASVKEGKQGVPANDFRGPEKEERMCCSIAKKGEMGGGAEPNNWG